MPNTTSRATTSAPSNAGTTLSSTWAKAGSAAANSPPNTSARTTVTATTATPRAGGRPTRRRPRRDPRTSHPSADPRRHAPRHERTGDHRGPRAAADQRAPPHHPCRRQAQRAEPLGGEQRGHREQREGQSRAEPFAAGGPTVGGAVDHAEDHQPHDEVSDAEHRRPPQRGAHDAGEHGQPDEPTRCGGQRIERPDARAARPSNPARRTAAGTGPSTGVAAGAAYPYMPGTIIVMRAPPLSPDRGWSP